MQNRGTRSPAGRWGGQSTVWPEEQQQEQSPKGCSCTVAPTSTPGTDTSRAWPPRKASRWQLDPQLGPAFLLMLGDSFKLGRGGGDPIQAAGPWMGRDQNAANTESSWRRLSYSQAQRTSNWSQKKSSSAPCGKQLILNHFQLSQMSCENTWQKLQHSASYVNRKQRRCTGIFLHAQAREEQLASDLNLQKYLYDFSVW